MKQIFYTLTLLILFPITSQAQWESLGDNIIPINHRVWSIKVAPDQSVWATATLDAFPPSSQTPKVFRSIDEGNTWTNSEIPEAISTYGWDISPIDGTNAFVALDTAGLYQTIDGGQNWTKVESYGLNWSGAIHFFNSDEGWAFGSDGTYLVMSVTSDGGSTWTHIGGDDWVEPTGTSLPSLDMTEYLPGFTFSFNSSYDYDEQTIIVGTSKGTYWISTDKGYNWTRQDSPLVDMGIIASNIAMKDENTFMVAGDIIASSNTGTTTVNFTTTDGGTTWIEGNSGVTAAAAHYIPNSDSVFVMVGHNNFGWGNTGTSISYNYGEDWEMIDNTSMIAIDFIDENTGYGSCCNNAWQTANGQIHKWNFELPTSTVQLVENNKVELMPNPVNDELSISLNNEFQSEELVIEIISASGRVLYFNKVHDRERINITTTTLPKGFHLLRIKGDNKYVIKKFIKE